MWWSGLMGTSVSEAIRHKEAVWVSLLDSNGISMTLPQYHVISSPQPIPVVVGATDGGSKSPGLVYRWVSLGCSSLMDSLERWWWAWEAHLDNPVFYSGRTDQWCRDGVVAAQSQRAGNWQRQNSNQTIYVRDTCTSEKMGYFLILYTEINSKWNDDLSFKKKRNLKNTGTKCEF